MGARLGRVPFVPQADVAECGSSCLAMILAYHGTWVPTPELRRACNVSRNGSSALDLVNAARAYGLQAQGIRIDEVAGLGKLSLPAILHWDFSHYVVLERVGRRHAVIVDPRFGRISVPHDHVGRHFTGIALALEPGPRLKRRGRERPSQRHYLQLLRPHVPTLLQLLCASLVMQALALAFPVSTRVLVDHVLVTTQESWLWALGIGLGTLALASLSMAFVRGWVLQSLQVTLDRSLLGSALSHLLKLPIEYFLQREIGDLVQRVQANTMIRAMLSEQSIAAVLDVSLVVAYALLMFAFHPMLGAMMAGIGLVQFVLIVCMRQHVHELMLRELNATGAEEAAAVAALSSLETTRALGIGGRLVRQWQRAANVATNRRMERGRTEIAMRQGLGLLRGLATVLVLWVGGHAVLTGRLSLGEFTAFLALSGMFLVPMEALANAVMELQMLAAQLRRMDDVLGTPAEPRGQVRPQRLQGRITFDQVCHRYADGLPWSVHGISLAIEPGEKVAIVGRSGSGKSTLARLLAGLHLPTEGRITVDGIALVDHELPALRRAMGTVLQEPFLFDATIRENIALHDPEASLDEVRRAARMACIGEFVESLPQGYETRVGENGNRLSGGQRQRLCMAQALLRQPGFLILDEATSALDQACEARVHANLRRLGCTQVVIAHRLATVCDADRILVMREGAIVEVGNYAALAAAKGEFAGLVHAERGAVHA